MHDDVRHQVKNCYNCQLNKVPNLLPQGKLQPHEIPTGPWDVVTADFLTELPRTTRGHNSILVIVDKLSKRGVFVPTNKEVSSTEVAQLFQDHLFSKHGIPNVIISDRDPKFKAKF